MLYSKKSQQSSTYKFQHLSLSISNPYVLRHTEIGRSASNIKKIAQKTRQFEQVAGTSVIPLHSAVTLAAPISTIPAIFQRHNQGIQPLRVSVVPPGTRHIPNRRTAVQGRIVSRWRRLETFRTCSREGTTGVWQPHADTSYDY